MCDICDDELGARLTIYALRSGGKAGKASGEPKATSRGKGNKKSNAAPAALPPFVDYFGQGARLGGEGGGKFYVTTAINYTNGPPPVHLRCVIRVCVYVVCVRLCRALIEHEAVLHYLAARRHMGHAYEAVTSDVLARYHRAYGRDAFFLTGTDEHGQKIADSAKKAGRTPQEHCDVYAENFQKLNTRLHISNDFYVRTTQQEHSVTVEKIFRKCLDAGDIYLGTYKGWYNIKEELFVTEKDAEAVGYKDAAGNPLVERNEPSYFFRMSKYHARLVKHIKESQPTFVQPDSRRKELLARLDGPRGDGKDPDGNPIKLLDLSISRTTEQLSWGIPVPDDDGHVLYVWFDALTNYLSGVDYWNGRNKDAPNGNNADRWPADVHVIGKDIVWFHCVIWPCMLMSAGVPLPKCVFAHGFVNATDGQKMSKSIGNVIDPNVQLDMYPVDTFRYYLVSPTPYGNDLNYGEAALVNKHNNELGDAFGNLVQRALKMAASYCDARVPAESATTERPFDVAGLRAQTETCMARSAIYDALNLAMQKTRATNEYLTRKEPWKMKGDARAPERRAVVRTLLEAIYVLAHFLAPVMPTAASSTFQYLGTVPCGIAALSQSDNLKPGTGTAANAAILFPTIEVGGKTVEKYKAAKGSGGKGAWLQAKAEKKKKQRANMQKKKGARGGGRGGASGDIDFSWLDVRVGRIEQCEVLPQADKLYVEQIDVGEDKTRQIVSGLRLHYTLEQMRGRRILVVCNMKRAKLAGVESLGMVLCAKSDDGSVVEFVDPPAGASVGERVFVSPAKSADDMGPACSASQTAKKKVARKVLPDLKTVTSGTAPYEAQYRGRTLLTSAGPVTAPSVAGGNIN